MPIFTRTPVATGKISMFAWDCLPTTILVHQSSTPVAFNTYWSEWLQFQDNWTEYYEGQHFCSGSWKHWWHLPIIHPEYSHPGTSPSQHGRQLHSQQSDFHTTAQTWPKIECHSSVQPRQPLQWCVEVTPQFQSDEPPGSLSTAIKRQATNGARLVGSTYTTQRCFATSDSAWHRSSDADLKEVHICFQSLASKPDGPAAPLVLNMELFISLASILS